MSHPWDEIEAGEESPPYLYEVTAEKIIGYSRAARYENLAYTSQAGAIAISGDSGRSGNTQSMWDSMPYQKVRPTRSKAARNSASSKLAETKRVNEFRRRSRASPPGSLNSTVSSADVSTYAVFTRCGQRGSVPGRRVEACRGVAADERW